MDKADESLIPIFMEKDESMTISDLLLEVSDSLISHEDANATSIKSYVRRSIRNPQNTMLKRNDVQKMFKKITDAVFDEMIRKFWKNKVCQALYIQNITRAIGDEQLMKLIDLLKRKKIWCMNIGENYNITNSGWRKFCDNLPNTNITHLYVSEHVIDIDLKNKMRDYIRMNRTKHTLHNSVSNIRVIERCTHMWWNPVNSIRHQLETISSQRHAEDSKKREKKVEYVVTPHHTQYWAEKLTHLDDTSVVTSKRWKFACSCGETCTSYENHIYHPTGRMYECTKCSVWSHVECVLGADVSDDDIVELQNVLCFKCKSKTRRQRIMELKAMGISWVNGNFVSIASASGINSLGEVGESESGCLEVSESIEAPSREDNPNDMSEDGLSESESEESCLGDLHHKDGDQGGDVASISTTAVEEQTQAQAQTGSSGKAEIHDGADANELDLSSRQLETTASHVS